MGQLWYFRIFYVLFFFSAAMIFSQTSVFLESKQLSGSEIGVILASISFAAMVSQPIIGIIADRLKNRRLILQLLFFVSAFFVLFLANTSGFLPLLILVFVFSLFLEPIFTLADTSIIEAAKYDERVEYGKVRWFGSIAWGIGSLSLGIILQFFGGFSTAFTVFAILMVIAGFMVGRFPNHQAKTTAKVEWHELGHLLKNRHFIFICLFSIFVGGVSLTANNYLALRLMNLGAAATIVGIAMFLPTLLEIISFNFSGKVIQRLGLKGSFLLVCAVMTTAQFIFFFAPHYSIAMVGMFLQGLIFPISISAIYQFLAQHFEPHILTTVSTFRATLAAGLSTFVLTLLAGFIYDAFSLAAIFLMTSSLMIIAGIVTFCFFPRHHPTTK
ncbi:MAG: MFS transporter [Culicoidibacterales bacterium]